MRYHVIQTIQSTMSDEEPVEVPYYRGDDQLKAVAALLGAACDPSEDRGYFKVLSVRIDFVPANVAPWKE